MISDLGVIIAAGGSSLRYGEKDKLTEELGGIPVFLHCICNFLPLVAPGNMAVAVRAGEKENFRRIAEKFLPGNHVRFVDGGCDRAASVRNALDALMLEKGLVAIHDAARPLATAELLLKVVEKARVCGGAIAASKVADTLKKVDGCGMISGTVSRDAVYCAETPQVFDLENYRAAYAALSGTAPTDDAGIMQLAGFPVAVVDTGIWNIKLTSPHDLAKLRLCFPEK